jgi:thiamine biosynthesis lipoprotein
MARPPDEPVTTRALLRRLFAPALFVFLVFSVYFRATGSDEEPAAPTSAAPEQWELSGETMGTTYSVKVVPVGELTPDAVQSAIAAALEDVNAEMSTWRDQSQISRFNRAEPGQDTAVSAHFLGVLAVARDVAARSRGAFDPTVGPLVRRWGFGPDGKPRSAPTDDELAALGERIGLDKVEQVPAPPQLRKSAAGVELDLSAIAKGHGVDRVHDAVRALGVTDVMVEIGGEVRASGRHIAGRPWRLAIEKPDAGRGVIQQVVELKDEAMATSGDYRNYLELDGQRVSHTIDPRTRRPVTHTLASVTVLHDDCTRADAWATALNVLGPDDGPALADREGLRAYFLVREDGGFREVRTAALTTSGRLVGAP